MSSLVDDFRAGLREGRLPVMACPACDAVFLYPRHRCPACHEPGATWRNAEGAGTLHSYTVVRAVPPAGFDDQVPYALGVVRLAEGAQLLGRLVPIDGDWSAYTCDAAVRFDAEATRTSPAPGVAWFRVQATA